MSYSSKNLSNVSRLIHFGIALLLCGFLIAFSTILIDDADQIEDYPQVYQFEDHDFLLAQETAMDSVENIIEDFELEAQKIERKQKVSHKQYENAKTSFDNWLAARETIGSNREDDAVLQRANELDVYFQEEQILSSQLDSVNALIDFQNEQNETFQYLIYEEDNRANKKFNSALKSYQLNVFLIRLAIVLPLLILALVFIVKFRRHKYWPLFLGYILFALYAFFLGLVPYLPSYGGYIRYAVGIVLSIGLGVYAINKIRSFIERKRVELKVSQEERANKVEVVSAEKAYDNHHCPSCGKGFLIKSWKKIDGQKSGMVRVLSVTNYCRYCGLVLFRECDSCDTKNFVHLPFCSNCGDVVNAGTKIKSA